MGNKKLYQRIREDFPLAAGEAEAIALGAAAKAIVATDDKHAISA